MTPPAVVRSVVATALVLVSCENVSPTRGDIDESGKPFILTSPRAGDTVRVGDTMHVRWRVADTTMSFAGILLYISSDDCRSWFRVSDRGSIDETSPQWGDFEWVVPEQYIQLVSDSEPVTHVVRGRTLRVRLQEYDGFGADTTGPVRVLD